MKIQFLIFQILILLFSVKSFSASKGKECSSSFEATKPVASIGSTKSSFNPDKYFKIIASGRDDDVIPKYNAYITKLYEPNGVLDRLGIPKNFQLVEFMTGTDLNAVAKAGTGGYPISHYLDGAEIIRAHMDRTSLIYEVVYPGPTMQHAFYRDDNPYQQQLSIINHVIGHNHFANTSFLKGYRYANGPMESLVLDDKIREYYATYNKDEVARWHLFMQTVGPLQDFYSGYFQTPSEFAPSAPKAPVYRDGRMQYDSEKHPKRETENVLQAFIANIPPYAASWKREMSEQTLKLLSFQTALVRTQVMNEGWATFMQRFLMAYMGDSNTPAHWLEAMHVMNPAHRPRLNDPYGLGIHAWDNLYAMFLERPNVKLMPNQEARDRAFVRYAEEEIISKMDDYHFLKIALTDKWLSERDYAIVKPDEDLEDDSQLPPMPNTQEPVMPWKIESRDPNRIRQFIIHQNIYGKIRFRPRVKLVDFQRRGSGEVELVLNDELGSKAPLETNTVAPSLYAMSQILEKPISLEANLVQSKLNHELLERFLQWGMSKEEIIANFPQIYSNQIVRARIVVAGNAEVRVYIIDPKTKMEEFDQELSDAHANILDTYLTDLYLEDSQKLKQVYEDNPRFNMKMTTAVQTEVGKLANSFNIMGVMNRVPSVATALNEYQDMLERRMLLALERSLQTNKGLVKVGQQLYLKALPSVVNLSYDFRILNYILRQESSSDTKFELNAKNLNTSLRNRNFLASLNPDEKEGGRVAPIPGDEGDHFWGPGNPDGGEGEGNDPANGPKPGENPSDPSWVPISDELYAQFLGERLKLPNLNPKLGRSEKRKKVLRGNRNQKTGHELPEMILENALNKGSAIQVAEGKDPSYDLTEAAAVGFAYMQPNVDWVVKGTKYKPKPDINAVVTFVLDASGSTASHYQAFKKMVFDFKALIKSNYKEVKFNFVVFDSESKEVDEEQFFRIRLGGGTDYATGLNHVLQIQQEKYPIANWDRFSFFFGDLEDGNMERSLALLQELVDESSYVGMVRGSDWGMGTNALRSGAEQMHADSKYFGYVDLDKRKEVTIEDLRKLLKNDQEN